MATSSPLSFLDALRKRITAHPPPGWPPPPWLIHEITQRALLLVNHVVMQEPQAMARMRAHQGRRITLAWQGLEVHVAVTPAGLLEALPSAATPADLRLVLADTDPREALRAWLEGGKPRLHVQGDVMLAADINWLVDHLRWEVEEDLARWLGDARAHQVMQVARRLGEALRRWVVQRATPGAAP